MSNPAISTHLKDRVAHLLFACDTSDTITHPTALFNEGWMLRLTLDWFAQHPGIQHPLAFMSGSRWFSEALLRSQFRPRSRGDKLGESHTRADGAIGHFKIGSVGRGDLSLLQDARQFVVLEAKMFSGLSAQTKNVVNWDQAARNVACMVEVMKENKRHASEMQRVAFYVLAPQEQIDLRIFSKQLDNGSLYHRVRERVAAYGGEKDKWLTEWFEPDLAHIDLKPISWESIVDFISQQDPVAGADLRIFLDKCLYYNRPALSPRDNS